MMHPKPAKRTASQRKPLPEGREILTPYQWAKRRLEVGYAAGWLCKRCGRPTGPSEGDAHHKERRGLGGGTRDDRKENLDWVCRPCHREEHA